MACQMIYIVDSDTLQSAVSTTLPTITHDLNGGDFVWVVSAYGLAATALLPATGALADVRTLISSSHISQW